MVHREEIKVLSLTKMQKHSLVVVFNRAHPGHAFLLKLSSVILPSSPSLSCCAPDLYLLQYTLEATKCMFWCSQQKPLVATGAHAHNVALV